MKVRFRKGLLLAGFLLVASGCGGSSPEPAPTGKAGAPDTPPGQAEPGAGMSGDAVAQFEYDIEIKFLPFVPRSDMNLSVQTRLKIGVAPIGRYQYDWYINGTRVPEVDAASLPRSRFKKGDRVYVEIIPWLEVNGTEVADDAFVSETVEIHNTPPFIHSVVISPSEPRVTDPLTATPGAFDIDGDKMEFRFEWFVNGSQLIGKDGKELPAGEFMRGSQVFVRATPIDGEDKGNTVHSEPVEIKNSPPRIFSVPPETVPENGLYVYEVEADDPDGDALEFSLEKAPRGMKIDPETGELRWKLPEEGAEPFEGCRIVVSDGAGATTSQTFRLTLEPAGDGGERGAFRRRGPRRPHRRLDLY